MRLRDVVEMEDTRINGMAGRVWQVPGSIVSIIGVFAVHLEVRG